MRRAVLLAALTAVMLPDVALAQTTSSGTIVNDSVRRIRSVVIYGDDNCPKATNPDEVVVCSRRPEVERFRLPPSVRDQALKNRKNRSWASRARDLEQSNNPIGSCTAVGPSGGSGCLQQSIRDSAEERRDMKAADNPTIPK